MDSLVDYFHLFALLIEDWLTGLVVRWRNCVVSLLDGIVMVMVIPYSQLPMPDFLIPDSLFLIPLFACSSILWFLWVYKDFGCSLVSTFWGGGGNPLDLQEDFVTIIGEGIPRSEFIATSQFQLSAIIEFSLQLLCTSKASKAPKKVY